MNGKELKSIRVKLNLTQVELAERLKVTSNTIARWERDEVPIKDVIALAITSLTQRKATPH